MGLQDSNTLDTVTVEEARRAEPNVPEPDALALKESDNNHDKAILKAEGGFVGAFFGSRTEKPGNVALIVILLCFTLIFCGFFKIDIAINSELFFKLLSVVFGIVTLALGYLFGSSNRQ